MSRSLVASSARGELAHRAECGVYAERHQLGGLCSSLGGVGAIHGGSMVDVSREVRRVVQAA
jgi:hypothetical protein